MAAAGCQPKAVLSVLSYVRTASSGTRRLEPSKAPRLLGTVCPSHETDASDSFMEGLRRKESPGAMNARTFYWPDRCHP